MYTSSTLFKLWFKGAAVILILAIIVPALVLPVERNSDPFTFIVTYFDIQHNVINRYHSTISFTAHNLSFCMCRTISLSYILME